MKNPSNILGITIHRMGLLSLVALMALSLTGCWRSKKCCKTTAETVHIERVVEETPCSTCNKDIIDEFPVTEAHGEHVQERVSGPSGWGVK